MSALKGWLVPLVLIFVWMGVVLIVIPRIIKFVKRKTKLTKSRLDDLLVNALDKPLIFFLIGLGLKIFIDLAPLSANLIKYATVVVIIIFVYSGILFVDKLMIGLLRDSSKKVAFIESSAGIVKSLFRVVVYGIALLIVMDSLGISITPLIASLGVASLAVALALQETLSNFFSGLYLFIDKPIRVGDYIKLESGERGYVDKIGWRSTHIRLFSNNIVVIPNSKLASSEITNFHFPEPNLSIPVDVGVSYDSDLEKVEKVTIDVGKKVLKEMAGGVTEFDPFIRYHTFGDFSINFTVYLRVKEYVDKYLVTHEFIKRLHKKYREENINIPFPITTVFIERNR